ncbi:MAG TPA: hypothetical protein VHE54_07335 [Puia sp.]|nr:hypothetical protein [Puia sp.]
MKKNLHERVKSSILPVSRKLAIFGAIAAASLIATKSYSQVYVGARIGFRVPGARLYVAPPPVVYQQEPVYAQPAPEYTDPDVQYDGGYYADPSVCEADFPGYAYYDYPAWYGHYRDRVYFEHYRPFFERDYHNYFIGGRFDHARFDHDRGYVRGYGHGGFDRGNSRGFDHGYSRGGFDRGNGHGGLDRGNGHGGFDRGNGHGFNRGRGFHDGRR